MTCCVSVLREHAALEQSLTVRTRSAGSGCDLDPDQQAAAANRGHTRRAQRTQLAEQVLTLRRRTLGEPLVDEHVQRGAPDGGGERVAAERAAVVAGPKQRQQRAAREHGRHRIHAAAERLAEHEHVGLGAWLVLVGEHLARAAQSRLNLVEHEQHVALAA